MLFFSGSLPETRVALQDFDPFFITFARAAIAGAIAVVLLWLFPSTRPDAAHTVSLAAIAACVVFGFPILTALALRDVPASHSLVFIGLLPLCTALFGVIGGAARPRAPFWIFAGLGAALVIGFSLGEDTRFSAADGYMLLAFIVCGYGYAAGARVSRDLSGWRTICWALVLALPFMGPLAFWRAKDVAFGGVSLSAWAGLAYVSVFSMLLGVFCWYRGLAEGGVVAVGQLQLLQPFFGLLFAALVLGEPVGWRLIATSLAVSLCVYGARRFAQ